MFSAYSLQRYELFCIFVAIYPIYNLTYNTFMIDYVARRALTADEIAVLECNGCTAVDWADVTVAPGFDPARCRRIAFSGKVSLGRLDYMFDCTGGIQLPASISRVRLHNCVIGDNVYIDNVANYIANYEIGDYVFIENVNRIVGTLDSSFGIGTEVSVLNETGGREVPIYEGLSAQTAYLIAMYRHDTRLTERLAGMVRSRADELKGRRGMIAEHSHITNTGEIHNVNIGAWTRIDGASRLTDGTVVSSRLDPVYIGTNVMASGFILSSGSRVEDGVVLVNSFVGQACHLSHLFSAHDSLFFANCTCENGEAAAIFAGPYTVTMHKSSLLIAGMFSFLNAGSGSNQSNHMYKLGPIHQGVVERGSKTTSDSYVLWPARIGAFSLVMGRHVNHPDTSMLPFSYLIENYGRSFLVPGVNLKSVGTIRDARKWPQRDRRRDAVKLDHINFNLLSPYTASKMFAALDLLDVIEQTGGLTADAYSYRSMTIRARALRHGREYYNMALDKFMGNSVISRLKGVDFLSASDITAVLTPTSPCGEGVWLDIAGMIAPESEVRRLCSDIADGTVDSLDTVAARFASMAADYYDMEWTWVASMMERWYGKRWDELTPADVARIVERWRESVIKLDRLLYDDARKEFSLVSRIGFGVDGSDDLAAADFEQVRGDFDSDSFVKMVLDHIDSKSALANELLGRLSAIL